METNSIRRGATYRGAKGTYDRHVIEIFQAHASGPTLVRYSYRRAETEGFRLGVVTIRRFAEWAKEEVV